MSERGNQLFETADGQISELMRLVSRVGETGLSLPCPGLRIAAFLQATDEMSPARPGRHRVLQTKELT